MVDGRAYDNACALRAVTSTDGMIASYFPFAHDFLGKLSLQAGNEVRRINRVGHGIMSKPPGTTGWG